MEVWCYPSNKENESFDHTVKTCFTPAKKLFCNMRKSSHVFWNPVYIALSDPLTASVKQEYNSFLNKNLLHNDSGVGLLHTTEYIKSKFSLR